MALLFCLSDGRSSTALEYLAAERGFLSSAPSCSLASVAWFSELSIHHYFFWNLLVAVPPVQVSVPAGQEPQQRRLLLYLLAECLLPLVV